MKIRVELLGIVFLFITQSNLYSNINFLQKLKIISWILLYSHSYNNIIYYTVLYGEKHVSHVYISCWYQGTLYGIGLT